MGRGVGGPDGPTPPTSMGAGNAGSHQRGGTDEEAHEHGPIVGDDDRVLGLTNSLAIGVIRQLGTDLVPLRTLLSAQLGHDLFGSPGYSVSRVKLSRLIARNEGLDPLPDDAGPVDRLARLKELMDLGDRTRASARRGDAVLLLAIQAMVANPSEVVEQLSGTSNAPPERSVYIFESLMHPDEVQLLRQLWGNNAFVIATMEARDRRRQALLNRYDPTQKAMSDPQIYDIVARLIARDEHRTNTSSSVPLEYRLSVGSTHFLADLFLTAESAVGSRSFGASKLPPESTTSTVTFLRAVFGDPFATPTRDEFAMRVAQIASECSSAMSRRVGAAIAAPNGQIVSIGFNEVPRAGGGVYWAGMEPDHRTFQPEDSLPEDGGLSWPHDPNVHIKNVAFSQVVRLSSAKLLQMLGLDEACRVLLDNIDDLIPDLLLDPSIVEAEFFDVTEYHVELHAEMLAITDAVRRGVPIEGATLYTTTYPCSHCARLIIASGVLRVVYQEPYPKSKANRLFRYDVAEAALSGSAFDGKRVLIEPFVGIAPRSLSRLMSFEQRMLAPDERPDDKRLFGLKRPWAPEPGVLRGSLSEEPRVAELWHALRFGFGADIERHILALLTASSTRTDSA